MRSLDVRTSEPKRASLVRRWTSSVSAALSSASETWVASERRPSCSGAGAGVLADTTSRPRVSARTRRPSTTALRSSAPMRRSARRSAVSGRPRGGVRGRAEEARAVAGARPSPGRRSRRGARRDDLERVVLDEAQQRLRVRADERLDRVEGGERDLVAARRGDERRAGGAEHPLAGDRALLLAHEAGHADDDEAEQAADAP